MPQTLIQTAAEISVSGGTSGNVTLSGVGAGHLLTASCVNDSNDTATFSVSDNQSNSWQTAVSQGSPTDGAFVAILYAVNVAGGNTTVTVTASASITFHALVQEWSGSDASAPLTAHDSDDQAFATAHQASSAGINPAAPCICLVAGAGSGSLTSPAPGSGYTGETSSSVFDFYEYQIFSSAPANEHGNWATTNGVRTVSVIAAFKAAAAAASAPVFIGGGVGTLIGA